MAENLTAEIKIRMTPAMKERLIELAQADNRTLSGYLRLVLEQHLRSVECFTEFAVGEFMRYSIDKNEFTRLDTLYAPGADEAG